MNVKDIAMRPFRALAYAIVVAALATAPVDSQAGMITVHASGVISDAYCYGEPPDRPYEFSIGESLDMILSYEANPFAPGFATVTIDITSGGGELVSFTPETIPDGLGMISELDGVLISLNCIDFTGSVYILSDGDFLLVNYGRDDGTGTFGHGFAASLSRSETPTPNVPAPEPSTLILGLIGFLGILSASRAIRDRSR